MSKTGKLAMVVFKQLLNQDSPKFFTSNISSCRPHYSNTKVGTSSFREELHHVYNCARSVKDMHKEQMVFHHYVQSTLQPSSCLFPWSQKKGAALSQHFPSQSTTIPTYPPSRLLPLIFAYPFPFPKPSSSKLHVQLHFPFSAKK